MPYALGNDGNVVYTNNNQTITYALTEILKTNGNELQIISILNSDTELITIITTELVSFFGSMDVINESEVSLQTIFDSLDEHQDKRYLFGSKFLVVVGSVSPTIELKGPATLSIVENSDYSDAGVSASDIGNVDVTALVESESNVVFQKVGTYQITYSFTSPITGIEISVQRQINITAAQTVQRANPEIGNKRMTGTISVINPCFSDSNMKIRDNELIFDNQSSDTTYLTQKKEGGASPPSRWRSSSAPLLLPPLRSSSATTV